MATNAEIVAAARAVEAAILVNRDARTAVELAKEALIQAKVNLQIKENAQLSSQDAVEAARKDLMNLLRPG